MDIKVLFDEPMSKHTTFKIGGAVRAMYFPETASDMVELCKSLYEQGITPYIIGNGSNLLVSDAGPDIVIINTSKLRNIVLTDADNNEITADSGVLLSELAVFAYKHELTGLEFAHGIPGTLGGAVVMNAGAYNGEMKNVVISTKVYSFENGEYELKGDEHNFSYRNSAFSSRSDVILSSVIRLQKGDKDTTRQKMDELATRRRESQPLDKPSAGSTFKRPKDGYAAALIEQAGLKGFSIGGAEVSEKHAGFVVNTGNATFNDVISVIEHVQETVMKQFGVMLEPEIKILT
ncbi:MAG: UDP-N-acetylmuramate dehydrogenase [Oscillospiraceae bacterium]|nr:UDP-N-acetylmuramate dehydrogenase [Oscillospiraceae bacterium]